MSAKPDTTKASGAPRTIVKRRAHSSERPTLLLLS
jgi:hypothetical protein